MLIVLEGLDGAGKSTQVKKLKAYLETINPDLKYIHFPRYDSAVYGDLISRFLRGEFGNIDSVHPNLVALLFAEDRHGAADEIRAHLAKGGIVLLDRYVYSNIAYQGAKVKDEKERERLSEWIFNTEYKEFGIPVPDLNIFLDVPVSFVEKSLSSSRSADDHREYLAGGSDIHEADIEFQKAVRCQYLRCCEKYGDFLRIDCSGPDGLMMAPDDIFAKIKSSVSERFCK